MSKRDVDRKGILKPNIVRKSFSQMAFGQIDSITRREAEKNIRNQPGPRKIAFNAFIKRGKMDDAYLAIFEKFGEKTFSKETICKWVEEEMKKVQSQKSNTECSKENEDDGR